METTFDALKDEIRDQLDTRRSDWKTIARDADVSYSWIAKFVRGDITNPRFDTLKSLHACLAKSD